MIASLAVAALFLLPPQERTTPDPSKWDRVVPLRISAGDPVLEGRGPSKRVEQVIGFTGTLHVWTQVAGDVDTSLRVEDGDGRLLAEDDDSGGKPTPYVKLPAEPGRKILVIVAASSPGGGVDVDLHLVAAPETETTREEAESAAHEFAEIKSLRRSRDLTPARTRMEALIEHLLELTDGAESELVADQILAASVEADALNLLRSTERAKRFVLSHCQRMLPGNHRDVQGARANLALTIRTLGDLSGARELQETVRDVYVRTLPADHADLQRALMNLAATLAMLGDLHGACALEEKVLEVRTRTLPDDHPDLQSIRANHALTIRALGDLAGARILQEKVLEVFTRTLADDHPHLQLTRMNLAVTVKELGDLPRARVLEEKLLEVYSRTLPGDHPDLQRARLNLAATLYPLGDLAGARSLLEKALEVLSRTMPAEHPDLQLARDSLAITLRAVGDVASARSLQEKVLEVRSRTLPEDHPDLQKARQSLAITIGILGDLAGARELEEKVLETRSRTLSEGHPDLQAARVNLAGTLRLLGDLQGARALEEKVLEVRSHTLPADHPDLQLARANLATTLGLLGNLTESRTLQERVLEVRSRTLPDDHPDLQAVRQDLAITIALQVANSPAGAPGSTADGSKETQDSRNRYGALVEACARSLRRATRTAILNSSSREAEERIASQNDSLGRLLSSAAGLGVFAVDSSWEREAFLVSEATRGAALSSARLARTCSRDPGYSDLCARRRAAVATLAQLALTEATTESFENARARLEDADRDLVGQAGKLSVGAGRLLDPGFDALALCVKPREALIAYRSYARSMVARGTPPREERIPSLCAFIVRRGGGAGDAAGMPSGATLRRIELGPIAPIERAVELWREALGTSAGRGVSHGSGTAGDSTPPGEALRALMLDPLREPLRGVDRVLVALDDVLNAVPLDALPAGDPWRVPDLPSEVPLGQVLRITLRASLFDLLVPEEPPTGSAGLLALGGIDFGSARGANAPAPPSIARSVDASGVLRGGPWEQGFPPLPGSLAEVRSLRDRFAEVFGGPGGVVLLEGEAATREHFFEFAPKARFLHVATHGWFAPDSFRSTEDPEPIDAKLKFGTRTGLGDRVRGMKPMFLCGLALAGASAPENELGRIPGLITAEEIAALDLSNCELGVLSACDTNVGLRRAGQGVASLQRALEMAGARSVITSLWKVPDEATKDLMLDFYRRLWVEKKPKWQALWEAKMKIRSEKDESGKPKYSTRDWAAWALTGDPN